MSPKSSTKNFGKRAQDIFAPTVGKETQLRLTLSKDQIDYLDHLVDCVHEQTGCRPGRAEVINAIINTVKKTELL